MNKDNLDVDFSGEVLYGDDFNYKKIKEWFKDEKEGYSEIIDNNYTYGYHELNKFQIPITYLLLNTPKNGSYIK